MHELSIAQNIIEIVRESTDKNTGKKVTGIHLKIGEMSNVLTDSLIFSFESLIEQTDLEGAKLIIERMPVKLFCHNCKKETDVTELTFNCIQCSSSMVEVVSGNELLISELEIE